MNSFTNKPLKHLSYKEIKDLYKFCISLEPVKQNPNQFSSDILFEQIGDFDYSTPQLKGKMSIFTNSEGVKLNRAFQIFNTDYMDPTFLIDKDYLHLLDDSRNIRLLTAAIAREISVKLLMSGLEEFDPGDYYVPANQREVAVDLICGAGSPLAEAADSLACKFVTPANILALYALISDEHMNITKYLQQQVRQRVFLSNLSKKTIPNRNTSYRFDGKILINGEFRKFTHNS